MAMVYLHFGRVLRSHVNMYGEKKSEASARSRAPREKELHINIRCINKRNGIFPFSSFENVP